MVKAAKKGEETGAQIIAKAARKGDVI